MLVETDFASSLVYFRQALPQRSTHQSLITTTLPKSPPNGCPRCRLCTRVLPLLFSSNSLRSLCSSSESSVLNSGLPVFSSLHRSPFTGQSAYTSNITGKINGRFEVCLLIYLFKSTRIFSLITDQSARSSRLDISTVRATHSRAPASISFPFSLINPRVTISGADSTRPVCLSIAIIGITTPSSDRCFRSRTTISSISSSEPQSPSARPADTGSRRNAPSSVNSTHFPSSSSIISPLTTPNWCASAACRNKCRYSPCTGIKYFGFTSCSSSFCSSWLACPDT